MKFEWVLGAQAARSYWFASSGLCFLRIVCQRLGLLLVVVSCGVNAPCCWVEVEGLAKVKELEYLNLYQ